MTKIIKKKMYCSKCNQYYQVPVVISVNSYDLDNNKALKSRYESGTIFKNFCPVCKEELVRKDYE